MLDVRRLRILRELADRGTIAATAQALGYSPPAVSQQLAVLEREAGVRLLEPDGRRRRLTDAGRDLVGRTESILRELEAAEAAVARSLVAVAGALRIAAFPSALRTVVAPAAAALGAEHPDLRVATDELEPEESLPALKRRDLDVALTQAYPFSPRPPDAAVALHPLFDDPLRLALAAGRPAPSGSLAELAMEPWVAGREGTWCHEVVLHAGRAAGFEPHVAHHTNDFAVAYAHVAARSAIALIPALAGPPPPGVDLHPLPGPPLSRRVSAAIRSGSAERPAIAAALIALGAVRPAGVAPA
jgi:DNA-binding transcriptional LysR family regulator